MKRLFIVLFVLSLVSCENFMYKHFAPVYPDLPAGVTSLETAFTWCSTNITYKSDMDVHCLEEYWQSGRETMELRTGDCEDFAILFCCMCHSLGMDARLVVGNGHATARINGTLYDCVPVKTDTGFKPAPFAPDIGIYDIEYEKDIDTVLRRCYAKYGSY
jgi:transglutaminase-like putative cysteine protease